MQTGRGTALTPATSRRTRVWAALLAAAVIGFDQLTKLLVVNALDEGESRPIVDGVLWLSHIRNPGAAFGLLRGFGGMLALAAVVGVVVFAAVVVRNPDRVTAIAAAFVAGGAAGNLLDRLLRPGGVVDFVDLRFWPAFNIADSAISVGAVLFLWTAFRDRSKRTDEDASARPGA